MLFRSVHYTAMIVFIMRFHFPLSQIIEGGKIVDKELRNEVLQPAQLHERDYHQLMYMKQTITQCLHLVCEVELPPFIDLT